VGRARPRLRPQAPAGRAHADGRISYPSRMNRDDVEAELLEIEELLQDDRLKVEDRHALHGAQQALRNVLDPDTWHPASQTFYRIDPTRSNPVPP
jgi:hypothetical protein